MKDFGLSNDEIKKINAIFSNFPRIEKVLIYGSRAMGTQKPASDIDLTLIGNDINLNLLLQIELRLDDLMLPYKFDISIFQRIENQQLVEHINRIGKVFYANNISTL